MKTFIYFNLTQYLFRFAVDPRYEKTKTFKEEMDKSVKEICDKMKNLLASMEKQQKQSLWQLHRVNKYKIRECQTEDSLVQLQPDCCEV